MQLAFNKSKNQKFLTMKKFSIALALVLGISFASAASNYHLNDASIDALFANSTEVSLAEMGTSNALAGTTMAFDEKNEAVIAWVLCWIVGGFGVHRHYLGTKKNMWLLYTITCAGVFGVVPTIDFWVLLIDGVINNNIGKYQNNEKFLMWM